MLAICPLPDVWHRIHLALVSAWEVDGCIGEPPPTPLILAGWAYSNDLQKHAAWKATIAWAEERSLLHLIPALTDAELHRVSEPSSYAVGPLGGPLYLSWNREPRARPSSEQASAALTQLLASWTAAAGPELSRHCRPLRFSGRKLRCLVVEASPAYVPPWGSWASLSPGPARRTFTALRAAINAVIAPHEVDHIVFISSGRQSTEA